MRREIISFTPGSAGVFGAGSGGGFVVAVLNAASAA